MGITFSRWISHTKLFTHCFLPIGQWKLLDCYCVSYFRESWIVKSHRCCPLFATAHTPHVMMYSLRCESCFRRTRQTGRGERVWWMLVCVNVAAHAHPSSCYCHFSSKEKKRKIQSVPVRYFSANACGTVSCVSVCMRDSKCLPLLLLQSRARSPELNGMSQQLIHPRHLPKWRF